MSYLTAYRAGSQKYGGDRSKHSNVPGPYKPKTKPDVANDNEPRPANDNRRRLKKLSQYTAKGARYLRRSPLHDIGGRLLEDLILLYGPLSSVGTMENLAGWTLHKFCALSGPPTHVVQDGTNPNPTATTYACVSGQVSSGAFGIMLPMPANVRNFCTGEISNYSLAGVPRYRHGTTYKRPNSSTQPVRRHVHRSYPKPHLVPLPIYQPMQLPFPIPYALVPYRANDPLGSQRTQGDRRLKRYLRLKPPPGTKERKVRGIAAVVQALQHAASEGLDLLDAIHDALPKGLQAKAVMKGGKWWNASPQAKLAAIANNFGDLDLNEAFFNVVQNHFEDKLIGTASKGAKGFADSINVVGGPAVFGGFAG